jgi:PEGA domain
MIRVDSRTRVIAARLEGEKARRIVRGRRACLVIPLILLLPPLEGCALMQRGTTDLVRVESTPAGARVVADGGSAHVVTPGAVVLSRRGRHSLTFEREGYERSVVTLDRRSWGEWWRNLVWIHPAFWLVGIIVDNATGAAYDVVPNPVSITLVPNATKSAR